MKRPRRLPSAPFAVTVLALVALALPPHALATAERDAAGEGGLLLVEVREIGTYRVETWASEHDGWVAESAIRVVPPQGEPFEFRDARVGLVEQAGDEAWEARAIAYAPGDDLTGDGVPDLLIEGYGMGAHCCFRYALLSLGARLEVVWEADTRDSGVALVDLRGDGARQILFHDMRYAYAFCSFADSPAPTVVLELRPDGVSLANASYPLDDATAFRDALWAIALDSPWFEPGE